MIARIISDWDDAYSNGAHVVGSAEYPARWAAVAGEFRKTMSAAGRADLDTVYGEGERQKFDLFRPEGAAKGLLVFVHGGYWMRFDKSFWSHLAAGPLGLGYAVAMPSYRLCPEVLIADIGRDIGKALETAARLVAGPIMLAGHSAGGHLVTRMMCEGAPVDASVQARIRHVLSISGVHDLRPLMRTAMNATLRLTMEESRAESPALLDPFRGLRLTCWVGAAERAEFIRQTALLANVWAGLGASTETVEEPDRHHFNIIDGLADPDHPMMRHICPL